MKRHEYMSGFCTTWTSSSIKALAINLLEIMHNFLYFKTRKSFLFFSMFSHWTVCITNCILVTSDYSKKLTSRLDRIGSDLTCTFRKKSIKKNHFKLLLALPKSFNLNFNEVLGGGGWGIPSTIFIKTSNEFLHQCMVCLYSYVIWLCLSCKYFHT